VKEGHRIRVGEIKEWWSESEQNERSRWWRSGPGKSICVRFHVGLEESPFGNAD